MSERRGVTSAVEFVLTIAIAAALMTGLVVAASGTVERQKTITAQTQMEIVGQQVAGTIENADRLVQTAETTTTLRLEQDLPERVLQSDYTIEITPAAVRVRSPLSDRAVSVPFESTTPVAQTTVESGDVAVQYDTADTELEVRDV